MNSGFYSLPNKYRICTLFPGIVLGTAERQSLNARVFAAHQRLGGVAGFVAANLLQFSLKGPHRLMFLHPWYPGMALFEEVIETLGEGLARVSH